MATFTISSVVSPADDGIAFAIVLRETDDPTKLVSHNIALRTEDIDIARRLGRIPQLRARATAELGTWLHDTLKEIDFFGVEQFLVEGDDDVETVDD
jgi:hypothetical protein